MLSQNHKEYTVVVLKDVWNTRIVKLRLIDALILLRFSELDIAGERLAESPIGRCYIICRASLPIAELNSERQTLTIQISQALPVSTPIPRHGFPIIHSGPFNPNSGNLSSSTYVAYKHQFEIVSPIDGKSDASTSFAPNSA